MHFKQLELKRHLIIIQQLIVNYHTFSFDIYLDHITSLSPVLSLYQKPRKFVIIVTIVWAPKANSFELRFSVVLLRKFTCQCRLTWCAVSQSGNYSTSGSLEWHLYDISEAHLAFIVKLKTLRPERHTLPPRLTSHYLEVDLEIQTGSAKCLNTLIWLIERIN